MGIFIACKDNKEVVSNEVQEVTNSYLKFDGKYLDHLNAVKIEQVKDLDKPITHLSSEVSERIFENIKISLLKNSDISKIEKVILYTTDENLYDIKLENIKAFSIFSSEEKDYHTHHLFKKNNDTFSEDKNYIVRANHSLEIGDINQLSYSLMENESSTKWVLFKVKTVGIRKESPIQRTDEFKKVIINNAKTLLVGEGLSPCRSASETCPNMDYGATCTEEGCISGGGGDGPCSKEQTDETAMQARMTTKNFDSNFAYDFRDNFLKKSEKGKKYIDYYYKISRISSVYDGVNMSNIKDRVKFVTAMYKVAHILIEGKDNDIVFDDSTTEVSLNTIKDYSKLSENKEYKEILKDIEKDVRQFSKKTKKEIKSQL